MTSHRVLMIDDEPSFRAMMRRALEREGYEVQEMPTGAEGLDCALRTTPDLILLDVNLPDLGGLKVLERLIDQQPSARVIMITGQGDVSVAVEAMKLGASDFLPKPPDLKKLNEAITSLLRRDTDSAAGVHSRAILGDSPEMREVWLQVSRYSRPDVSILLTGESGTGKELFARAIHERSKRGAEPFVALDCATLPDTLVESELFGHEKGAFTGAAERKQGKFEIANGGTILLDEVGNLPLHFQAKLLRAVQERTIDRLGGSHSVALDVRFISATNIDLQQAIRKGTFREDLFYRLAEVVVTLPPLRSRRNDVDLLASSFIDEFNQRFGRAIRGLTDDAWRLLRAYPWPGNVRELRNALKVSFLAADDVIGTEHLPEYIRNPLSSPAQPETGGAIVRERLRSRIAEGIAAGSLDLKALVASYSEEVERAVLEELLEMRRFNQNELCALLKVDPKTLRARLLRFGFSGRSSATTTRN